MHSQYYHVVGVLKRVLRAKTSCGFVGLQEEKRESIGWTGTPRSFTA